MNDSSAKPEDDPASGDRDFSAAESGCADGANVTREERARYEQLQSEINAMILLEEEKEAGDNEITDESGDDLLLPL